ncbi:hypothetical protein, partial [Lactobacillus jensenii]
FKVVGVILHKFYTIKNEKSYLNIKGIIFAILYQTKKIMYLRLIHDFLVFIICSILLVAKGQLPT